MIKYLLQTHLFSLGGLNSPPQKNITQA